MNSTRYRRYTFVFVISANLLLVWSSITTSAWAPSFPALQCRRGYRKGCIPLLFTPCSKQSIRKSKIFSTALDDDDVESDEEVDVRSPQELRKALWEMSNFPTQSTPTPDVAYSVPDLTDLQSISKQNSTINATYPEYPGRITNGDDDSEEQLEHGPTKDDGWFLNEDDYVHSSERLNPDGSLNLELDGQTEVAADEEYQLLVENLLKMQSPNVPSSFLASTPYSDNDSTNTNTEPTLESLLQQKLHDPTTVSEELHAKVFEQEEGFLNQSQVFRESLVSEDSEATMKAMRLRRGADYRKRQDDAFSNLSREMDELEAQLNNDENLDKLAVDQRCFKCGCALSPEELQQFHSKKNAPASRRLCSICYSDLLVANSDKTFFRDSVVPSAFKSRRGRESSSYSRIRPRSSSRPQPTQNKKRPTARRKRDAVMSPPPQRTTISPPPLRQKPLDSVPAPHNSSATTADQYGDDKDDIQSLKKEIIALHEELQHLKEETELDLDDIGGVDDEWEESPGNDTRRMGAWSQMIDPDTGDVFWWNEETEEMKWEL